MDVGARETEDALKKELAEVKDQVTAIKERTAEVRHGSVLFSAARLLDVLQLVGECVSEFACLGCRSGEGA
jgi:hypothetical protein